MAVGDVKAGINTISAGQSYSIQPPVGEEWVIHNLYYETGGYKIDFQIIDGVGMIGFDSDTSSGARLGVVYHLTNTHYLKVVNTSAGTTMKISYDGIQTK